MKIRQRIGSIQDLMRRREIEDAVSVWLQKHRPNASFVEHRTFLNSVSWLVLSESFLPCTLRDMMIFRMRPFRWPRTLRGYWNTFITLEMYFGEWTILTAIKYCEPICFDLTQKWLPRLAETYLAMQHQGFEYLKINDEPINMNSLLIADDDYLLVTEYIIEYKLTYKPNPIEEFINTVQDFLDDIFQ